MEEIQDRSHDYLQQEKGQIAVKTNREKRKTGRRDPPREDRGRRKQRSGRKSPKWNVFLPRVQSKMHIGVTGTRSASITSRRVMTLKIVETFLISSSKA
ncbi:hypothetical protein PIB30_036108 [Stylosanthes scabra]|uniref:Uncharacterized protein n=1 Tax=Stylosanthes scabra TaxID=79078 RepID=A0ABU6VC33_9FABA|nr:hypothetical protein [Stylosanthes scabra]